MLTGTLGGDGCGGGKKAPRYGTVETSPKHVVKVMVAPKEYVTWRGEDRVTREGIPARLGKRTYNGVGSASRRVSGKPGLANLPHPALLETTSKSADAEAPSIIWAKCNGA